jgi:DNA-binding IclR family transcriptional regulator
MQPVELDPLPDGHTPLEAQLRRELTKVMLQAKGMTPNQMHRSLNCTAMVLHDLCRALNTSLEVSGPGFC